MTDNTDVKKAAGFNRRKFIAAAAGTAVAAASSVFSNLRQFGFGGQLNAVFKELQNVH